MHQQLQRKYLKQAKMIFYLMDENVDPVYQIQLLRQEPTLVVWAVGDEGTPPKGTLDPEILMWCEEHSFILVTNNRTSMPVHLIEHLEQGHHVPGIFILNPNMSIGETITELILIALASRDEEYSLNLLVMSTLSTLGVKDISV